MVARAAGFVEVAGSILSLAVILNIASLDLFVHSLGLVVPKRAGLNCSKSMSYGCGQGMSSHSIIQL